MFQLYYKCFSLIFTIRFKVFILNYSFNYPLKDLQLSIKRKRNLCVFVCASVILLTVLSMYNYYHKDMTRIDCKIVYMSVCQCFVKIVNNCYLFCCVYKQLCMMDYVFITLQLMQQHKICCINIMDENIHKFMRFYKHSIFLPLFS